MGSLFMPNMLLLSLVWILLGVLLAGVLAVAS
jgi:hypothetical protein